MEEQDRKEAKLPYAARQSASSSYSVPRSQYASTSRTRSNIPVSATSTHRYFSSPYRAPLNPQERHESFVEHQRVVSSAYSGDLYLRPQIPTASERSSYTFFVPSKINPAKSAGASAAVPRPPIAHLSSSRNPTSAVRQASIGHKAKPSLTTVKRSPSLRNDQAVPEPQTPPLTAADTDELRAAVVNAFSNPSRAQGRPVMSRTTSDVRLPFESPTSLYSRDGFQTTRQSQMTLDRTELEPHQLSPTYEEADQVESGRISPLPRATPYSEKSASSTNALLGPGLDSQGFASRIHPGMRPPPLDIDAVRKAEARGSITSLPDLIRRATRLASNLDRGKTASTLSLFDLFKSIDKGGYQQRQSTYSDVLASFPNPNDGAPVRPERPATMWPVGSKDGVMVSEKGIPGTKKSRKQCCGISMPVFITLVVVTVLLCAAAILIPVFLIAIPNQNRASNSLLKCSSSHPCLNNGMSVVDNNACSCICTGGHTGSDCSKAIGPSCVTNDISMGSQFYHNATLGSLIGPLLNSSFPKYSVPLNSSILLSVFASSNLTCVDEDSLVQFTSTPAQRKRFVFVPGPEKLSDVAATNSKSLLNPTGPALAARETTPQTSNDIVYQATSTQDIATQTFAAVTSTTPATNVTANITSDQLEFAKIIVLYVLETSRTSFIAVNAKQTIEQYFKAGGLASGNSTVNVTSGSTTELIANFAQFAIVLGNGQVVGGSHKDG